MLVKRVHSSYFLVWSQYGQLLIISFYLLVMIKIVTNIEYTNKPFSVLIAYCSHWSKLFDCCFIFCILLYLSCISNHMYKHIFSFCSEPSVVTLNKVEDVLKSNCFCLLFLPKRMNHNDEDVGECCLPLLALLTEEHIQAVLVL